MWSIFYWLGVTIVIIQKTHKTGPRETGLKRNDSGGKKVVKKLNYNLLTNYFIEADERESLNWSRVFLKWGSTYFVCFEIVKKVLSQKLPD